MKTLLVLLGLLLALFLTGCATPKYWSAIEGSRSDGVIRLGYRYALFEAPQIDNNQGAALASQKCQAWGYSGANAFGTTNRRCTNFDRNLGCIGWLVTADYQCTSNRAIRPID